MLINPPPATYSAPPMNRQTVSPLGIPGLQNPIGGSNSLGAGNMAQTTPVSRLPAMGSDQGMGAGPGLANQPFPHASFQPPALGPQGGQTTNAMSMANLLGQQK